MFINMRVRNEVPLQVPADICCNCGATTDLKPEEAKLKYMPLMGLVGAEVTVPFPLPFCPKCKNTANRRRPSILGKLTVSVAIGVGLITAWFFFGGALVDKVPIEHAAAAIMAGSLFLVFGWYALKRPSGAQTSYYQPVQLVKVSQKWPADIKGMVLSFSNPAFMGKFVTANQTAISQGVLVVRPA